MSKWSELGVCSGWYTLLTVGAAAGRNVEASFQKIADQMRTLNASKHRSRLLDPAELPRRERPTTRLPEMFWRKAASGKEAPVAQQGAKRRAKATLPRAKHRRVQFKPGW